MSAITEVLISLGWIIVLCIVWALFVLGTSIAWNTGQTFVNFRISQQLHKWLLEAKAIHDESRKDWGIENPNEVKNDIKPKRAKR
jgi:hypothetical protein